MVGNLLGSGTDYNLGRLADYAPGLVEVFGNLISKGLFSLGIALKKQKRGILCDNFVDTFFPFVKVKAFWVMVEFGGLSFHGLIQRRNIGFFENRYCFCGKNTAGIITGLGSAVYVAFHCQLAVGKFNGGNAQAKGFGKASQ